METALSKSQKMKLAFLTFSVLLLSFVLADNSTTSQSLPTFQTIEKINTYSEFEIQLRYINTCSKILYFDAISMGIEMELDSTFNSIPASSWEDIKHIIDLENENNTATKKGNQ